MTMFGSQLRITATTPPGGSSGQIQWNNGGSFGGFTAAGDVAITPATGQATVSKIGGVAISLGGAFSTSGAYSINLAAVGNTTVTLPTSGTLLTAAGAVTGLGGMTGAVACGGLLTCSGGTISMPTIAALGTVTTGIWNASPIANAYLANSSITLGGQSVALGASAAVQGNGAKVQLGTGSPVAGHCASYDSNLNIVDAGGACTTGGASGTVGSGVAGNVPYYSASGVAILGNTSINISSGTLSLGQSASVGGSLKLFGSTSGYSTITPSAAAGSTAFVLPTAAGTLATQGYVTGLGYVTGPGSSTTSYVPQWANAGGYTLGAGLPVGTAGNSTIVETTSAGTLSPTILPLPGASALGGVQANEGSTGYLVSGISTGTGQLQFTQPIGSGTANQFAMYATTGYVLQGNSYLTMPANGTLAIGTSGGQGGTLELFGSTSGYSTIAPSAAAGSGAFVLPTTGGTLATQTYVTGLGYVATSGANTFTAAQTFAGASNSLAAILANAAETATVSATAASGTVNYYLASQSVLYYTTAAAANWNVNLTGSAGTTLNTMLATGQSVTIAFIVTQGSTAYYNSAFTIDGSSSGVTTYWLGGLAPAAGHVNGLDVYTYSVIKTGGGAYTVLASQAQY
jgi:hypothetical protein